MPKSTKMKGTKKRATASRADLVARTGGADSSRPRVNQTDFPQYSLKDAERVALGLWENFAGKSAAPPEVALAIGISPTSSAWRYITGSAAAYGITAGGFNAAQISLTPLGKRLVAPEAEADDVAARREAVLKPQILSKFFDRYNRAKFPPAQIVENVMVSMGVPKERASEALKILIENGRYAGFLKETPTGLFVMIDAPSIPGPAAPSSTAGSSSFDAAEDTSDESPEDTRPTVADLVPALRQTVEDKNVKVFITHGKNRNIVSQIKELLAFGQFEPVVSVERETTAIPVPEKVFEDMRSCRAGVIHVNSEGHFLDQDGKQHLRINENVLIEIGAAMALFGKRVILLVEKGVALPSNLQGLYRCEYDGERLDYEATMKLLKTFSQFRG